MRDPNFKTQAYRDNLIDSWATNHDGTEQIAIVDTHSQHGTCMASLAVGSYASVSKYANLVAVQYEGSRGLAFAAHRAIFVLGSIYKHVIARGEPPSVISVSELPTSQLNLNTTYTSLCSVKFASKPRLISS